MPAAPPPPLPEPPRPGPPLLEVDDLHVEFRTPRGTVRAVNGLGYTLHAGQTLALLGESGSGKSVAALAVMGLLPTPPARITRGAVRLHGRDLLRLSDAEHRKVRGTRIAMVFQDALSALNPVLTVGHQIGELFRVHRGLGRRQARARAVELMDRVRIPAAARRVDDYPHQFSGGMRQRVMIAMALALDPEVVIADEPTTALDVTVQAQIMRLLAELQQETGTGLLLITHDLGVVASVADRITVMYAGRVVEESDAPRLYAAPAHPYTRGLLESVPRLDRPGRRLVPVPGSPPDLAHLPTGCAFHPRCAAARARCADERPALLPVGAAAEERSSACHFTDEVTARGGRP
ncbi:ABC transporter ATP-binding protein [Kitasatospora phosalacinea]|uniref:ABC transporter ATP-binding protein n=1 Tax=Kitasatospora phosalacinea TaxID=2065 RepID=UPI00255379A5|nr:ABC transporter ATP-binding protein [Kitasatospora phosalacinea]